VPACFGCAKAGALAVATVKSATARVVRDTNVQVIVSPNKETSWAHMIAFDIVFMTVCST
jgi:hypothetical protein